jgi:hypothetical protein
MIEIYNNISDNVKKIADAAWSIAAAQKNPMDAA